MYVEGDKDFDFILGVGNEWIDAAHVRCIHYSILWVTNVQFREAICTADDFRRSKGYCFGLNDILS